MESKNREIYNHLAESYNQRQDNPATERLRKKEISLIKEFASGLVLDLGCGTGFHLDFYKNIIGLDISENMLKTAKEKNKFLVQGDIENLPIKKQSVDSICCFYGTLNLVGLNCVRQVCRAVRKGGKVLLSITSVRDIDKYRSSPENKIKKFRVEGRPINMRLFEKEEVVEAFRREGFELIHFDSVFRIQKPRWCNFQKFSLLEKIKIGIEGLVPKICGRVYFFVFEKVREKIENKLEEAEKSADTTASNLGEGLGKR